MEKYYIAYFECSDKFSENFTFAKRYKSISSLLTSRIGVQLTRPLEVKELLQKIEKNVNFQRTKKLNEILNTEHDAKIDGMTISDVFNYGNIENFKIYIVNVDKDIKIDREYTVDDLYQELLERNKKIKSIVYEPLKVVVEEGNLDDEFWN